MKALVERMKNSGVEFQGDLAFVKDWQLFWSGMEAPSPFQMVSLRADAAPFPITSLETFDLLTLPKMILNSLN
jgi:hypothetical protein